jgi:hypothetical protein
VNTVSHSAASFASAQEDSSARTMLRTLAAVADGLAWNLIRPCLPASPARLNIAFSGAYVLTSVLPAVEQACIAG